MGADGDAVVDGGAEELLESVVGFEVEGGSLVVADQQSLPFEGADQILDCFPLLLGALCVHP